MLDVFQEARWLMQRVFPSYGGLDSGLADPGGLLDGVLVTFHAGGPLGRGSPVAKELG